MSTPSTEIHVAISADRVSAIKGQLLLRSLVRNGHLPGPWKLVFTAAPATGQGYEAPWFAWRKHANVEFRPVPENVWTGLKWQGVLLQRLLYSHSAEAVLFMALDALVVGGLAALVRRAAAGHAWLMVPARKPPADADLDALITALKLPPANGELHYSGYGLEFLQPRDAPPYFNTALAAAPAAVANAIAASLMPDWQAVAGQIKSAHGWRLALMANLMRNQVPVAALDQRYSLGNADHSDEPLVQGPVAEVAASHFGDALQHPRVLHYLVHSEEFQPQRDLDGVMALRAFCARDDGDAGVRRLREALRALVAVPVSA